MKMVKVAVAGARGYLGRESVRLLLQHPNVESIVPTSSGTSGPYGEAVPAFRRSGLQMVTAEDPAARDADVWILATPNEEAEALAAKCDGYGTKLVIDLSRAHRGPALNGGSWSYGMADLTPPAAGTPRIANPGCYPTATALAGAPALAAGLVGPGPVIVDGKSAVSGAGATPRGDLHFPEQNESMRAYKVLGHDHTIEMAAFASSFGGPRGVRFTPHLVPMNRGLLSTVYLPLADGADPEAVRQAYVSRYANSQFVSVVDEPDTSHVRGSNHAHVAVSVDSQNGLIVARCAIDNLVKGGAGQAVQNLNLALGLPESAGLNALGGGP